MRRTTILAATMLLALLMASGVALAATINGTGGDNTLRGTSAADTMKGFGGRDTIYGGNGQDTIFGGTGNDTINGGYAGDKIYGGTGNDFVNGGFGNDNINVSGDGNLDSIECGIGTDTAVVGREDLERATFSDFVRATSCENLTVR